MHPCLGCRKSFTTHKKLHSHEPKCRALAEIESNLARTHKRSRITPKAPRDARLIPDEIHASIGSSSTNPKPALNAHDETIDPEENMVHISFLSYIKHEHSNVQPAG